MTRNPGERYMKQKSLTLGERNDERYMPVVNFRLHVVVLTR